MKTRKVTLSPGNRLDIPDPFRDGTTVKWTWDDRLAPAIAQCDGMGVALELPPPPRVVRPGFYLLTAHGHSADGSEKDGIEYTVRIQSQSESAPVKTGEATDTVTQCDPKEDAPLDESGQGGPSEPLPTIMPPCQSVTGVEPPVLVGDYRVQVLRHGALVNGAEINLKKDKTLVVGRAESCDLCLRPMFLNNDLAKHCSRNQVEMFWSRDRLYVKNLGTNKVVLETGGTRFTVPTGECTAWSPSAIIELPGGLELRLARS
jgi:hypothetical protein